MSRSILLFRVDGHFTKGEAGVISQFPLEDVAVDGGTLTLQLGLKHTDCLAKELCGANAEPAAAGGCCGCG